MVRRFLTDIGDGGYIDAAGGVLGAAVIDHDLAFGAGHWRETVSAQGWRVLATADIDIPIKDMGSDLRSGGGADDGDRHPPGVADGPRDDWPVVGACLRVALSDQEWPNRGDSLATRRPWADAGTQRGPGIIDELSANQITRSTRKMRHDIIGLFEVSPDESSDNPAVKSTEVGIDDGE